jgi:hypothetical protein
MREVELPGEASDHVWMGRRIEEAVEQISERIPREMGLSLEAAGELEGCCFPEAWVRSVPVLLQCGFPPEGWRLVESGLLRLDAGACDAPQAWRLDVRPLEKDLPDGFELGRQRFLIPIVQGLRSVCAGHGQHTRLSVRASSLSESRRWVKWIRDAWGDSAEQTLPHVTAC